MNCREAFRVFDADLTATNVSAAKEETTHCFSSMALDALVKDVALNPRSTDPGFWLYVLLACMHGWSSTAEQVHGRTSVSGANGIVVVLTEKGRWYSRLLEAARRKTGGGGSREEKKISYRTATLENSDCFRCGI